MLNFPSFTILSSSRQFPFHFCATWLNCSFLCPMFFSIYKWCCALLLRLLWQLFSSVAVLARLYFFFNFRTNFNFLDSEEAKNEAKWANKIFSQQFKAQKFFVCCFAEFARSDDPLYQTLHNLDKDKLCPQKSSETPPSTPSRINMRRRKIWKKNFWSN